MKESPATSLVLVTGGAGFIGSSLIKRLLQEGYRVISLDNYSAGSETTHHSGATYYKGNTSDIATLITESPTTIFHLGEYSRVEQSFDDVEKVLKSNIVGTQAILEFARAKKSKLIYAGSSTKFADAGLGRDQSPYAWTKAANTELVRNYGEWFGLEYAIAYFYNVYGPGERGDSQTGTVIARFKEKYEKDEPLPVRLPGTQRRNFTHVDDIVEGLFLVGERGSGDEYGLGHTDSYSILEVADMFGGERIMLPERPGNRMDSKADVRRATLELGWRPKRNLPEYIGSITASKNHEA